MWGSETLLSKFVNLFLYIVGSQFQPGRDTAAVRQRRLGDTLTENIKISHIHWGHVVNTTKRLCFHHTKHEMYNLCLLHILKTNFTLLITHIFTQERAYDPCLRLFTKSPIWQRQQENPKRWLPEDKLVTVLPGLTCQWYRKWPTIKESET